MEESVKLSVHKTRRSRNENVRTSIGTYLKQRNYTYDDRYRKSSRCFTQSTDQLQITGNVEKEIFRGNAFLYSNVFCINSSVQVDQQFSRISLFIQSLSGTIKNELRNLLPPLLCHLYIEMLKGRDWKPATDFLKKNATILGAIENPSLDSSRVNGGAGQEDSLLTQLTDNHQNKIVFVKDTETSDTSGFDQKTRNMFRNLVETLSVVTSKHDIQTEPLVARFRSTKYRITLSIQALYALKRYLSKYGHVLILQTLQVWFQIDTVRKELPLNALADEEFETDEEEGESSGRGSVNGCESVQQPHLAPLNFVELNTRLENIQNSEKILSKYQLPVKVIGIRENARALVCASLDSDGCHVASSSYDSEIALWTMHNSNFGGRRPWRMFCERQCPWNLANVGDEVEEDEESACESSRLSCLRENPINRVQNSPVAYLRGHTRAVTDVVFSRWNPLVLSVSRDCTMRTWKATDYTCGGIYRGHNYPIWCVSESSNGLLLATGSKDTTARLWATDREHPLQVYAGHTQDVDVIAFHPNGNYLATGSSDLTVRLWCVTSGKLLRVFTECKLPLLSIAFSPDGKYLAAAGEEPSIRIFDLAAGAQLMELPTGCDATTTTKSITWSSDSRKLASAVSNGGIRIWEVHGKSHSASSGESSSHGSNVIMSYATGCHRLVRIQTNANNTFTCIGNNN
ncbi:TAF5-like RNA polymerase II p300/CBP-associated factor-associated factor 65 kDa subunit 5L [Phlebotomus argentipes]|uniref:TAF5-like RNA polymerase II p300/CBP-associated factor-associated factor 65 kDa subunit 5L n=1 Tax=Phlebotomus argentipes TaxID=94469 RepID=UPI002892FA0D|nr:TAF5-like RNA polymerase II p300/CBP-associated factor-associated factor 65 kDa subunit 5L [Phlebotomus argentipes]